MVLFFQPVDVSLLRVDGEPEEEPEPVRVPSKPKAPDYPSFNVNRYLVSSALPEESEIPEEPEHSPAGWWWMVGAAALAAGWLVVRRIRSPKSGGRR